MESKRSPEEIILGLILHSGDAKNHMYQALALTKENKFDESDVEIGLATDALNEAHTVQTEFLQEEASGNSIEISALFVHAQDHLMTAMSEINLLNEIIDLRRELSREEI